MNDNTNRELESYSSFDNRIKKIKEYIDDIRVDLDDLKHNEYNNNPGNQKHEIAGEQYNSDAYSFQEEGNKYQNEENLVNPKDHLFNSINTQELIQNMNSSLNRNYNNEENTTNSNLLLSNNSYNLNFNYNNNYEKKEKVEPKEMNIVDSPYMYKMDSSKRSNEENYQMGNFNEYDGNNQRLNEDLSKNYENFQNEKNNNLDNNSNDIRRTPIDNSNSNIYKHASPYSDKQYNDMNDYETKINIPSIKPSFNTNEDGNLNQKDKENHYYLQKNNKQYQENNEPKDYDQPLSSYPQSQVHSYRDRRDNYDIDPQNVNKNNNHHHSNLHRNNSHGLIKETLPYTNNTLNYNYKSGQPTIINAQNNRTLTNSNKNIPVTAENKNLNTYNPKPQHPLAVYERFTDLENNYASRSQEHLKHEIPYDTYKHNNNSGYENDKLRLNYNYPIHNASKNNQLIQSLEEIERSIERERSYSPNNHSQRKMNYPNYALLENRSLELVNLK
jgi:hypothetical protein